MDQLRLPFSHSADITALRHAAQAALTRWQPPELAADSMVVITELVGNVLQHTDDGGELACRCGPDSVLIEVFDESKHLPDPQRPDARRIGGRGLLLVAAMSRAWGSRPAPPGKVVWAEVPRTV